MFTKWIGALSAGVIIMMLSGCSGGGSSTATVDAGAATTLSVQAIDASTEELIANTTFTITSDSISAFTSTAATEETGVAAFELSDSSDPSTTAINASVKATAAGYLDSNKSIVISETGAVDLVISMVSLTGDTPTGTGVKTVTNTSTNGTVVGGITATAEATTSNGSASSSKESIGISIPDTVVMRDKDNNPITGNLTTKVAYYDADSVDALETFPGGFAVTLANPSDVNLGNSSSIENGEVTFVSAGFATIEIVNAAGEKVKSFSSPIPITFTISEETTNPDTGTTIAVGDIIPVWSFDTDTGKWRFEGASNAVSDPTPGDGLLQVTYDINHLSRWNLGWYRAGNYRCRNKTINILSSAGGIYTGSARIRIKAASGYVRTTRYRGGGTLSLLRAPKNVRAEIIVKDLETGESLTAEPVTVDNLCADSFDNITITPPNQANRTYVNLTVKTESICSNDSSQPTVPVGRSFVLLRKTNPTPPSSIGSAKTDSTTGETTFSQVLAKVDTTTHEYKLWVYDHINNKWEIRQNQTFSGDTTLTFQFPKTCEITTGAAG